MARAAGLIRFIRVVCSRRMVRRTRFLPVLVLALVAVCAVSLAHARPGETSTCIGVKTGLDSASALPTDLAAPLVASVEVAQPRHGVAMAASEPAAGAARSTRTGPRTPRAPPA